MRRVVIFPTALVVVAVLWPAPVDAQTEMSVTGAGAGIFPAGASYLGVPLNALELGMGLNVAGTWAGGRFHATLIGMSPLGLGQDIELEGIANAGVPSEHGTAVFSGTCTVDPGDRTPPLPGVPFAVEVVANEDGTGSLTLTLGSTNLPAATVNEGYVTVQ